MEPLNWTEYFTIIGTIAGTITTLYLGGGHVLRLLRGLILAVVNERLAIIENEIGEHHDQIFADGWGLRPTLSEFKERVVHLEGVNDGENHK